MSAIGVSNPIGGSSSIPAQWIHKGTSGQAIQGWMPKTTLLVNKSYPQFEFIRQTLTHAWNTRYQSQLPPHQRSMTGPFRAVMNAGDLLSRDNYTCGGTCQSIQSRPGLHGLRLTGMATTCTPSVVYSPTQLNPAVPASACNVKRVYDASDFTTFRKQSAMLQNRNDSSFGGDKYHSNQSTLRSMRR